jgi:hypothetical protein
VYVGPRPILRMLFIDLDWPVAAVRVASCHFLDIFFHGPERCFHCIVFIANKLGVILQWRTRCFQFGLGKLVVRLLTLSATVVHLEF